MTLARALAPDITPTSRASGEAYFASGAVRQLAQTESGATAIVRGGDDYVVTLEAARGSVHGSCTCPHFSDRLQACKHIWAVVLACDARGIRVLPQNVNPKDVLFEPIALGQDDDDRVVPETTVRPRGVAASWYARPTVPGRGVTTPPEWEQSLASIRSGHGAPASLQGDPFRGQLLYVIDLAASQSAKAVVLHVMLQERKKNGDWGVPKNARLFANTLRTVPAEDRALVERLVGGRAAQAYGWQPDQYEIPSARHLSGWLALELLPLVCATGRCRLAATQYAGARPQDTVLTPLKWDAGDPWSGHVRVRRDDDDGHYVVDGEMRREAETLPLSNIVLLLDEGLLLTWTTAARCETGSEIGWMRELRLRTRITVPLDQVHHLRGTLLHAPPPRADFPPELRTEIRHVTPTPRLVLVAALPPQPPQGTLSFNYDGAVIAETDPAALITTATPGVVVERDQAVEDDARAQLTSLGIRQSLYLPGRPYVLPGTATLSAIVTHLLSEGWQVERAGQAFRLPDSSLSLHVSSGIDWFDVDGHAGFGGERVGLPTLLAAIDRGDESIPLADGSIGLMPDHWRQQYAAFGLGQKHDGLLRFAPTQMALLDALLAERPSVSWDETFARARQRMLESIAIHAMDPPASFVGVLRGYQREGLGWLTHLQTMGFGGCLADDMGLGKTVMVLALLEQRRTQREAAGESIRPSLVVAPRSVIFNWAQEAARFAPGLRVLDYSTAARRGADARVATHDLVLTTYGALRKDAPRLAGHQFDYLVLDEAQTIKNASTVTAKAARLLNADHRLALSGTPVENRLADLWSIFEFLNPGLLSNATRFTRSLDRPDAGEEQLRVLGKGLRPFILRRTKEQVATDLPAKVEQTLFCELDTEQRTLYDELRDHYRRRLLAPKAGWERSKLQVLEALLRLRQAACHPALVDPKHSTSSSAKLDLLVPRLVELVDDGHKTLVFSQFTSYLALLRRELDEKGIAYEYLDGKTRDRDRRVARFQTDPNCPLFLISLKAGGLGLNLTAADYVFLLDPWWNPAVEAQAIDRSHRIGQTRHVFAYRLVAKDTVEERVLELQQRKKTVADAILTENNAVVKNLTREDLALLLS
ncbi:MAG: DEAD/DEAH box helicase [Vicinamibacterales bacterium]